MKIPNAFEAAEKLIRDNPRLFQNTGETKIKIAQAIKKYSDLFYDYLISDEKINKKRD